MVLYYIGSAVGILLIIGFVISCIQWLLTKEYGSVILATCVVAYFAVGIGIVAFNFVTKPSHTEQFDQEQYDYDRGLYEKMSPR